jgi:mannan endo-1,4-beta-mannosidase
VRKRILAVVLAMAALVAVVVGARVVVEHGSNPPAPPKPRTFPSKIVGIVSYNVPQFDRTCGCSPNVAVHYLHIGGDFDMDIAQSILATGAIPMLELEPYGMSLDKITSGREDTWLRKYAQDVGELGSPVIMSFAPEANGNWYSWGYPHVRPDAVVKAWRHVVDVFREAKVRNVKWAWIMNVRFTGSEDISLLWPGDRYVNILGIDGYFTSPSSFAAFFGPTIVQMKQLSSDPVLITETAAAPSAGKTGALSQLAAGVEQFGLVGFVWFDIRQHGSLTRQDWSLEDDRPAMNMFRSDVRQMR